MGQPSPPDPATLIIGMLSARPEVLDGAEAALVRLYGDIDLRSQDMEFTHTDYYEREMGAGLKRRFLSFIEKIDPSRMIEIKLATNALEDEFARKYSFAARPLNLDPGYICGSKLVLASTKDRAQRLYMGGGVYVEITLEFRKHNFRPAEMTYSDYRTPEYISYFTEVRARHLARR